MVDFAKLKANSGKKSLDKLSSELTKMSGGHEKTSDDRLWYPNVDKAGNGYAVVRFLPAPGEEDVPFVRLFSHGFKGATGSWYIENCPTTKGPGNKCPLCEENSKLWNSGIESDKKIVTERKRKLTFISNVMVITDQLNPENEGKVFLFKYGKKIFDKLNEAMNPQFADEEPLNPFDLWAGANFKIKIRNVEGYRNYDKSEFDKAGPLSKDDSEMEAIWKKAYSLQEFIAPSQFKSYDELSDRLVKVLGAGTPAVARKEAAESRSYEQHDEISSTSHKSIASTVEEEDDESLEFFKKLAG